MRRCGFPVVYLKSHRPCRFPAKKGEVCWMHKKEFHNFGCSSLVNPQDKCGCEQGRRRKVVRRAKDNLKRMKVEIVEGLSGKDFLGKLLRGR